MKNYVRISVYYMFPFIEAIYLSYENGTLFLKYEFFNEFHHRYVDLTTRIPNLHDVL